MSPALTYTARRAQPDTLNGLRPSCSFKVGDRIRLTETMKDDPCPVEAGTEGTVLLEPVWFQDVWVIGVEWDNGRALNLLWPKDKAEKIK